MATTVPVNTDEIAKHTRITGIIDGLARGTADQSFR